jgi:hypothetical protein
MISPATLLILTEQIGKLYPHEKSVDSYVNPLVDWMTQEWQSLKKRIVGLMMGYARINNPLAPFIKGESFNEALNEAEVWFPSGKQNQIWQDIEGLMKSYSHAVDGKAKDLEQKARIDANPPGLVDWTDTTPVRLALSKEGVEAVVKELQWQKDFVDDLTLDTKTRVSNLLSSRYGGLGEFRQGVERTFRVDRDNAIDAFKKQVRGYGQRVIDGKMSADEFIESMQSSIENHYKSLYRQGKGIQTLQEWEEELILKQAQTQNQYLRNFGDYIRQKQALGKDLTPYITARAELYGERGKSLFEAGNVAQMPDDALLTWQMQPAEHCSTCPIYASNSPYTKQTLPGYPGEGFHLTQCGVRCHCMVVLSDLYVTQKDLGLDIGKGFMPIPETPINVVDILTKAAGNIPKPTSFRNSSASVDELRKESKYFDDLFDKSNERERPEVSQKRTVDNIYNKLKDNPNINIKREQIDNWINSWGDTSADENPVSLALQRATKEEFNLMDSATNHLLLNDKDAIKQYDKFGSEMKAFVRAQYELTQEFLKDREYVTLYRGMVFETEKGVDFAFDGTVKSRNLVMQPISSFSTDPKTGRKFASVSDGAYEFMIQAEVPRERILSTCQTGFGCKVESEMVVLGGKENVKSLAIPSKIFEHLPAEETDLISIFSKYGE